MSMLYVKVFERVMHLKGNNRKKNSISESNFLPTHFELIENVTAEFKRYKCGFTFRRESRTQSKVKLKAYSW